jgi:hypothetical protein
MEVYRDAHFAVISYEMNRPNNCINVNQPYVPSTF